MKISCQEEMRVSADGFVERRRGVVFFLMAMHHLRDTGCGTMDVISYILYRLDGDI